MKEIKIAVRIDDSINKMGQVITHNGFGTEPGVDNLELILTTIAVLDNLKQQFLDKLQSKSKVM
jgi:hypothetical protein